MTSIKYIKSKYKGVSGTTISGFIYWRAARCGVIKNGFKTEKEAAKAVDLILIEQGKNPINILVKK